MLLLPSQLWLRESEHARRLFEESVSRRIEKQPDIGHRDHRKHRRREIREPQEAAPRQPLVDPHGHQQRERDRHRDRAERVPEVIGKRLPEDRVVSERAVIVESDEDRRSRAFGCRIEAVPKVRDRRIVREKHEQHRRRQQQQPGVQPLARSRHAQCLLVAAQQAIPFALGVLHRLFGRLRAGERGLQAVVQRLGHALVVMRRQLGLRERQLIARNGRGVESPRRIASSPACPTRRRARRRNRCRCPIARRVAASSPT